MPPRKAKRKRRNRTWESALAAFFSKTSVDVVVGVLILISVALTLLEISLPAGEITPTEREILPWLYVLSDLITIVFCVELFLRFIAIGSLPRFLRIHWLDLIAILPLFRALRVARVLRLLRLFGVISRFSSHFPYILRRGATEYVVVFVLLCVTVLLATGALAYSERRLPQDQRFSLEEAFWFSLYSLFAGEPVPRPPTTLFGKVVAVIVMFMGLTIFAMFTGTVSAFMVERLRKEERKMDLKRVEGHIIICGWNSRAEIIIREFRCSPNHRDTPIVIIAQYESEQPALPHPLNRNVCFINDDFTRVSAIEEAGIHRASTCIVLSDTSGGRNEQDADARTILAALTVEKLNPSVYTCAELLNRSYGSHLKIGHVNDYVVSGEYAAYLLAQASMNRGLMAVYSELLTYERGNELYRCELPQRWIGEPFVDVMIELKKRYDAILVAVHAADGEMKINPTTYAFGEGDEIVVIAVGELDLE